MKFLQWLKNKRRAISLWCLACVAIPLLLFLTPALFGYPQWVSRSLAKALTPKGGSCEVGHISGSLLTGFAIEDLLIQRPTKAGLLVITIPEAKADIRIAPLLRGKILPKELVVDNADVRLDLFSEGPKLVDTVTLYSIDINAKINGNGKLSGQLNAKILDVDLQCEVHLTDANDWKFSGIKKEGEDAEKEDGDGFKSDDTTAISADIYDYPLMENIHKLLCEIRSVTHPASSAYIHSSLSGSLAAPSSLTLIGTLGLADTAIYERPMLKAYGKFHVTTKVAVFPELHIVFNATETLSGEATADLSGKTIEGKFHADLMPENLFRLISAPSNLLPRYVVFSTPIQFDGELPKAPWSLAAISPVMSFDCKDLLIEELPVKRAAGKFTYSEKYVLLENLLIEVDSSQKNILNGDVRLELPEKTLQGKLEGNANLGGILHALKLVPQNTPLNALDNAVITATLNPSPLQDWHLWNAKVAVQQKHSVLANFPLDDLLAELQLTDKQLALTASASMASKQTGAFTLNAKAKLPDMLDKSPIVMDLHTDVHTDDKMALDANAKFIWENKDFRIDDGHGLVHPELLGVLMEAPLDLGKDSPMYFFECMNPEKPAVAEFHVPPIHATGKWSLEARVSMPEMRFLHTDFTLLETTLTLTENQIRFHSIKGDCHNSSDRLSCGLQLQFDPLRLQFNDVEVDGNPMQIAKLIYADDAIDVYSKIWKDFTWSETSDTHIHASTLEYREFNNDVWTFHLRGTVEAKDFTYNGMELREMSTDLDVSLPDGQLAFNNVKIADKESTEGDVLLGSASLQIEDGVGGTFHLEKRGGRLRTLELLMHVFSTIEDDLRPFDLAPEANFTCDGRFKQDIFLSLEMQGTMEAPSLNYRNFVVHNFKGTWKASDQDFCWDVPEAEFHGGVLATTGCYSFTRRRGELLAMAKGLPLSKLVQMVRKDADAAPPPEATGKEIPGALDIAGHFTFLKNWANAPFHLEGTGEAHITGADLWRFPTFHTLGIILANGSFQFFSKDKIASLGQITKLDTHFDCLGTTIRFKNIKTDGSIIALKGSGEYDLKTNGLDFLFSGELMKSVSLVSLVLRPIAWAFDARLTGELNDPLWNIQTPFSKIF